MPTDRPLPRLRLAANTCPTGYVDGGWWPHSLDLSAELPVLVGELAPRLGVVTMITFAPEAWQTAPSQLTVTGRAVLLAGSRGQDPYTVHVSGSDGRHLTLLVIPPESPGNPAHGAMMTASRSDNPDRPVAILAAGDIVPDWRVPRLRLVSDDPASDGRA
ncbi:MAG TPA: DUF5994 family protein [Pseudonocardiaceae bacterium]|nr:DUF5994 family protein [Pseudonocardiaceae bacterium]